MEIAELYYNEHVIQMGLSIITVKQRDLCNLYKHYSNEYYSLPFG